MPSIKQITTSTTSFTIAATLLLGSACGFDIGDPWGTMTSDTGSAPQNGVPYNFACKNRENWVTGTFPCTESVNGFCIYGPESPYHIPLVNACAVINDTSNWQADEPAIREACTATCKAIATNGSLCEDENWYDISTTGLYGKLEACADGAPADLNVGTFAADLGEEIADAVSKLECDLNSTCAAEFSGPIGFALWTEVGTAIGALISDVHASASPSSAAKIGGVEAPVDGDVAFSASACGGPSCPFFLGALSLQMTSSAGRPLQVGEFTVASASAELVKPTLGIWVPAAGAVIFPERSLHFVASASVGADVTTSTAMTEVRLVNQEPIYGHLHDGVFTLTYDLKGSAVSGSVAATFKQ